MVTSIPKRKASVLLNSHTGKRALVLHERAGFDLIPEWFDGYGRSIHVEYGAKNDARIYSGRSACIVMSDGMGPSWFLVSTTNRREAKRMLKALNRVKEVVF